MKYKCSCCKNYFSREDVMKATLSRYGTQYYRCRPCNLTHIKKWHHSKKGKEKIKENLYRMKKKFPIKQRARGALNYAVKHGKILKPKNCSKCNKVTRIEGHHKDYTKPLKVIWLCPNCHRKEDLRLKKDTV